MGGRVVRLEEGGGESIYIGVAPKLIAGGGGAFVGASFGCPTRTCVSTVVINYFIRMKLSEIMQVKGSEFQRNGINTFAGERLPVEIVVL
jgi:hypothetical protein